MKRENDKFHFVEKTVKQIGYPYWDKAKTVRRPSGTGRGATDSTTYSFVPFVRDTQSFVNALLEVRIQDSDTAYRYLCDWQYRERAYGNYTADSTAEQFALFFMLFDNHVFGYDRFDLIDTSLFSSTTTVTGEAIPQIGLHEATGFAGRGSSYYVGQICSEGFYCGTPTYAGCTDADGCDYDEPCPTWQCYAMTSCIRVWNIGGNGWYNGNPGGGNNGGGGGNNGGGPSQCGGIGDPQRLNNPPGPCSPGWQPIPPPQVYPYPDPNITNNDPDNIWWTDETTTFPSQPKPSWAQVYANFPKKSDGSEMCGEDVYNLVGGTVRALMPASKNACAVRVSRALLYSGVNIPYIQDHTFLGADGKYYFLSAAKLYNWLRKTFGQPNLSLSQSQGGPRGVNFPSLLAGHKGIYLMQPNYPAQFKASGHSSLYTGNSCITHNCDGTSNNGCYFDPQGGLHKISLWELQ